MEQVYTSAWNTTPLAPDIATECTEHLPGATQAGIHVVNA